MIKTCQFCGKEFSRAYGRGLKSWEVAKYCSKSCTVSAVRPRLGKRLAVVKPMPMKLCLQCGKIFVKNRRRGNTDWNNTAKFCSVRCGMIWRGALKKAGRLERFEASYCVLPSSCWQWEGKLNTRGYGIFEVDRPALAHRWIFGQRHGPVPKGLHLHHVCQNPACVNPDHLMLLTPKAHAALHPNRGAHLRR